MQNQSGIFKKEKKRDGYKSNKGDSMKEKTKVFTIRIPIDWHKKLLEIAEEECRTQNSVAKQAIKEFLEKNKLIPIGRGN